MTAEAIGIIIMAIIVIIILTIILTIIVLYIRSHNVQERQEELDEADEDKALQLPDENTDINKNKHLLGLIGSAILFVGVFAPIFAVPIVGNINSFSLPIIEDGDSIKFGTIILLLALTSFVLTLLKKYIRLYITGITSLFIVLYSHIRLNEASNRLEKNLMVHFQWGWPLLVIGAVLLISSAAIKNKH